MCLSCFKQIQLNICTPFFCECKLLLCTDNLLLGTVISVEVGRYCNKSFLIEGLFSGFFSWRITFFFLFVRRYLPSVITLVSLQCQMHTTARSCTVWQLRRVFFSVIVSSNWDELPRRDLASLIFFLLKLLRLMHLRVESKCYHTLFPYPCHFCGSLTEEITIYKAA